MAITYLSGARVRGLSLTPAGTFSETSENDQADSSSGNIRGCQVQAGHELIGKTMTSLTLKTSAYASSGTGVYKFALFTSTGVVKHVFKTGNTSTLWNGGQSTYAAVTGNDNITTGTATDRTVAADDVIGLTNSGNADIRLHLRQSRQPSYPNRPYERAGSITSAGNAFVASGDDADIYMVVTYAAVGDVKPTDVPVGSRFEETDTKKIFYYGNNGLKSSTPVWFEKGNASGAAAHTYTRGVFGGGFSVTNIMEYISFATPGDVTDFGDLTMARKLCTGLSSQTRGCFGGGEPSGMTDRIDYITVLTTGDAADFGNLVQAKVNSPAPASSATRGLWMGGYAGGNLDEIDYITIATLGNAADFGNLTQARNTPGGLSDDTRACCFGGLVTAYYNIIDYVTIATTGNASDFGDITVTGRYGMSGGEDATRGIMVGGKVNTGPTWYNVIDYITIQTTGNATDFGDLSQGRGFGTMCSGNTRCVMGGGHESSAGYIDTMEYITTQTLGNMTDFGDLSTTRADLGACEG